MPSNAISQLLAAQFTVSADAWTAWRKMSAKATAAKKEADTLRDACGFPETAQLVAMLGVSETVNGEAVIVDGNGNPLGKVTVYHRDAFVSPACYVSKVS